MLDFVDIVVNKQPYHNKTVDCEIYPSFRLGATKDIVFKGGKMIAFWNDSQQQWQTSKNAFISYLDSEISKEYNKVSEELKNRKGDEFNKERIKVKYMSNVNSRVIDDFIKLEKSSEQHDNVVFNKKIFFKDDVIKREDYSTNALSYKPEPGPTTAFDELMSVLYEDSELEKILWFLGAVYCSKMPEIQKGMYLYGSKGSGKGTVIKIIRGLLENYSAPINLKKLTGDTDFATSQIDTVPVLIDDEADLSVIKNDTELLRLISHDPIEVNKKYGIPYQVTFNGLLIAASNQRYKVRNIDSGITRRLVTIEPTQGEKHDGKRYDELMNQVTFEYPQIAYRAMEVFKREGKHKYDNFTDLEMLEFSDPVYQFVKENYNQLKDGISLKRVSQLYKDYLESIEFDTRNHKNKIKAGLYPAYMNFSAQKKVEGVNRTNWFYDIKTNIIFPDLYYDEEEEESDEYTIHLSDQPSILDSTALSYPAQLANEYGVPSRKWDDNTTILKDIDTGELHYVILPLHHIVIDFDLKDESGEKNLGLSLEAAKSFPPTYTELSKSGKGLHLHYYYTGSVNALEREYEPDIEIKIFTGKASLRRKLTLCNDIPIRTISHGLPVKGKGAGKVYDPAEIIKWNEVKLRRNIENNIAKKIHPNTKPSIDLIAHVLKTAEEDGVEYDLSDMRSDLIVFASQSSNQADYCMRIVRGLNLNTVTEEEEKTVQKYQGGTEIVDNKDIWFYDVEVFPNLFMICERRYDDPKSEKVYINPNSEDIQDFFSKPMIGFNNREYDNQIMYYAMLGESPAELYQRSRAITSKDKEVSRSVRKYKAKEMSYADIFSYLGVKQSLKKWQVELGIHHDEIEFPWDQPVAEHDWDRVAQYCMNDVRSTEILFKEKQGDYKAVCILSSLSGLSVNATTNEHTTKIMFGNERDPGRHFVYTDLSEEFPGYEFDRFAPNKEKSTYRGEFVGEGGYVYSEPGIHKKVGLFDIASQHPTSAIIMNYFGIYTVNLEELKQARIYIKHKDYESAKKMYGGKLAPYLNNEEDAGALSYALKIAINSIYGLTAAKFKNKFSQDKNIDNIVAKRGALFMVNLKHEVQSRGYTVAHIKTDSIKVADYDDAIKDFIFDYGKQYGYDFEHELTFEKLVLLNDAFYAGVYIEEGKEKWEFVGATFLEPYIQKTMFTHNELVDQDFQQVKSVNEAVIYLGEERIGRFAGVYPSLTGEEMLRVVEGDEVKKGAVSGTKGYRWRMYSEYKGKEDVDMSYFMKQAEKLKNDIAKVGDPEEILK